MSYDVSNEKDNYRLPGIQHKYGPTMVVMCSDQCLEVCEWCFRGRLFQGAKLDDDRVANPGDVIDYARRHKEVRSVLFTGGDSFLADKDYLRGMVEELSELKHITSFRFGTRAMVHEPGRVEEMMPVFMASAGKSVHVVLHIVRPEEVSPELVLRAKACLKKAAFLSQTPLMRGINDSPQMLARMFRRLTRARIQPYYVFQCRPVEGNERYLLSFREGHDIVIEAKKRLSGVTKRFRYVMSCDEGKLEIVGRDEESGDMLLKYYQARDEDMLGLVKRVDGEAVWLNSGQPLYLAERLTSRRHG